MTSQIGIMSHAVHDLFAGDGSLAITVLWSLFFPILIFALLHPWRKKEKKRLPPSPPAMPLLGHLHLIGARPHVSLRDLASRHGNKGLMLLWLGTVLTLVASSPRAAQVVLRTHDQSFASRPRSVVGDVLSWGPSDVGFAPYGEWWRQAKKMVTTHLLSTKKVQSYRATREEEMGAVISKIRRAAAAGAAVNLSELLSSFTSDVVCRAVAGRSYRSEGWDKVFRELIDAAMILVGGFNLENFYPGLANVAGGMLTWPARRRAERLRHRWDMMFDMLIDERAREAARASCCDQTEQLESDFVTALLLLQQEYGLPIDGIKGILADMFTAGTDTSYLVLEFAMAELMLHQETMVKLQDDVRRNTPTGQDNVAEENLTEMRYLKAVIKETLRLHPPSPLLVPHLSWEDCYMDGYNIPTGTTVFINAWAIGRDPAVWEAAEEFRPERFIRKGEIVVPDFRGKDFSFLPFGSGRRICPGINFAMASIEIMLANLVYNFDWDLPEGINNIDMTEVFGLTVHRKEKLHLIARSPSVVPQVELMN